MSADPPRPSPLARFGPPVAALLLFLAAARQAQQPDLFPDFFIFRLGAEIGLRHQSPYHPDRVRERVADQFPGLTDCAYLLPPAAVVLFAPFAALSWPTARLAWAAVYGLAALAVAYLPRRFGPVPPVRSPLWPLVPLVLLLNPVALGGVVVGQFPLVYLGCVAAGQWCFERGRRWAWVGCVLWAVPFVKPHVALPLVPLAWYLGGWTRAAGVLAAVGALNAVGGLLAAGDPLFVFDYLRFLSDGHKTVGFNRVELNPQITSWNSLLWGLGGPLVELSAAGTFGGYLVWFGLAAGRCAAAGEWPSAAWAAAASGAGAVLCSQVLVYELVLLSLLVPYLRDLLAAGWRRLPAAVALAAAWGALVPQHVMEAAGVGMHRPLAVAVVAALVLCGPPAPRRTDPA